MLSVTNLKIDPRHLDGSDKGELAAVKQACAHRLHLKTSDIVTLKFVRRSIDARNRQRIHLLFSANVRLSGGEAAEMRVLKRLKGTRDEKNVRQASSKPEAHFPLQRSNPLEDRVVVVGAGCAGIFCALALAHAGLEPLLIERGDTADRRTQAVKNFDATGSLDPESNIQFGMGGAGTFSDGKLATGTKSPWHKLVLETFAAHGARKDILWDAHPHVGSDVLPHVVDSICKEIEAEGGTVKCRCRMTNISVEHGKIVGITLKTHDPETGLVKEEFIRTHHVVLASGHSARDVFTLLHTMGITLERKTFAMGVRIEHLQADVNRSQYGAFAELPALGAAPYKLVAHLPNKRSAFSFCMCPGGYVVAAASEPEGVVTNGMSLSARNGSNANAGLLANIFPQDLPGDDPLAGIKLQRRCEKIAFELGGGLYAAPAQLVGDFLQDVPTSPEAASASRVKPTYPRGVTWGRIDDCLPEPVRETLRAALPLMARKLSCFSNPDAVLTGVESRSSSPVRITRSDTYESISCRGLWVAGEGAGYAGGIMSAAADGLRVAQALVDSLS